jgi:hypothetical protein
MIDHHVDPVNPPFHTHDHEHMVQQNPTGLLTNLTAGAEVDPASAALGVGGNFGDDNTPTFDDADSMMANCLGRTFEGAVGVGGCAALVSGRNQ